MVIKKLFFLHFLVNLSLAEIHKDWISYKQSFELKFEDQSLEKSKQETWEKNVALIEDHNKQFSENKQSYYMAINEFAHMSTEEVISFNTGFKKSDNFKTKFKKEESSNVNFKTMASSSVDWTTSHLVGPIKNQGLCGLVILHIN